MKTKPLTTKQQINRRVRTRGAAIGGTADLGARGPRLDTFFKTQRAAKAQVLSAKAD